MRVFTRQFFRYLHPVSKGVSKATQMDIGGSAFCECSIKSFIPLKNLKDQNVLIMNHSYSNCCSGFNTSSPSVTLVVKYDKESVDDFIAAADAIEEAFPTVAVQGIEEIEDGQVTFEIRVEAEGDIPNKILYSHRSGSNFPKTRVIVDSIHPKLKKLVEEAVAKETLCKSS
mmetsp:Transcript_2108/g.3167  ORF Transcript_2108/g.3167 Transcript_2108/m.3167 type:complete len:171 (-) Transcript_2108:400-912(-)|eukprot:CAMPEP_0175045932 /NCGR_PEP_ID=MMETSP0052_2-20121109/4737_1 /TAXON_ID=51329 ORGANISM="Polytomella parva, Strain SAG 63-3" /NCGR_SAMPLE_ID=MMETSP0052_2 /ASSEMBLY_ACC=CAM_ASM_000194 /LENGTH=170 /DNA_ID=CAMNT_0016309597 /DNA_START=42 /DNA_END=554 /DNA_ORIENTATION=-